MNNETQKSGVEECRRALQSCPHNQGTVSAMCRICVGKGEVFVWDIFMTEFLLVDCPRGHVGAGSTVPGLCPCMEPFSTETIAEAAGIRLEPGEPEEEHEVPGEEVEDETLPQEDWHPLIEALKWTLPRAETGIPVTGAGATELQQSLRAWAETHKEIRIPHPKAALILDLLDRHMIEFATVPETGKLVFRAKGATEEFQRFASELKRAYSHDQLTLLELLIFAHGGASWEFDPNLLLKYARGEHLMEIDTSRHNVTGECGFLRGEPEEIESVLLERCGAARLPPRKPHRSFA